MEKTTNTLQKNTKEKNEKEYKKWRKKWSQIFKRMK